MIRKLHLYQRLLYHHQFRFRVMTVVTVNLVTLTSLDHRPDALKSRMYPCHLLASWAGEPVLVTSTLC